MEHKKVIATKNFPAKLWLFEGLATYLTLDHFHAPGWLWGVVGTIFVIIWIGQIISAFTQHEVDLFPKPKE